MISCVRIMAVLMLASGSTAGAQSTAATAVCELHVWPTENYQGFSLGLLGAIGGAINHAATKGSVNTIKGLMQEHLGPDVQVEQLRKADAARMLGLAGYQLVVEPALPSEDELKTDEARRAKVMDTRVRMKSGARLSASTNPCYAELVGREIMYHKAALYGSNLFAGWTFRNFDRTGGAPRTFSGSVKNPLEDFPPKTPDKTEAARVEIQDAYAKDFAEFVRKKVRGAGAPAALPR